MLFGFIASGLVFAISYQLPVYYWGMVGVGMFYALHRPAGQNALTYSVIEPDDNWEPQPSGSSKSKITV